VKEESASCNGNGTGTLPSQGAQQPTNTDFLEEVVPVSFKGFYNDLINFDRISVAYPGQNSET